MKKAYEKPQIMFESFTMSTNIAAGCRFTNVTHSSGVFGCGYKDERFDKVVFTSESGCTTVEDDGDYNGICFHTPTDTNSLFAS